ncbi:MAG: hypothetical protein IBJ11_06640 [Phycisphaerales bacterium]|nr:hypothetical protein [Phycisphaerales bacterium]
MPANRLKAVCGLALSIAAAPAGAATLTWLDMSPTTFGSPVPNNSVYSNIPGIGPVTLSYSFTGSFTQARFNNPLLNNGNVAAGAYTWGPHELFGATNNASGGSTTSPWSITYTFSSTLAPGTIFLGVSGLGRTTSFGGGMTVATVNQNGNYLGDWSGGGNYGLTQYTGGVGTFSLNNSVSGAGGQDPWWNTSLAVIQIMDPISSLTVFFNQLPGDGVGVNIAAVPTPASAAIAGIAGLLVAGRRRRTG